MMRLLDTKYEIAITLKELAPRLAPNQINQALEFAKILPEVEYLGGGSSNPRLLALAALIPYLKSSERLNLLPKIYENRFSLWQNSDQTCTLIKLLPYFGNDHRERMINELLDFILFGEGADASLIYDHGVILACLLNQLTLHEIPLILPKIIGFSLSVQADFLAGRNSQGFTMVDSMRNNILRSSVNQWQSWAKADPNSAISLFKDTLHKLAIYPRPSFLTDLSTLVPLFITFSDNESVVQIVNPILKITTWWP